MCLPLSDDLHCGFLQATQINFGSPWTPGLEEYNMMTVMTLITIPFIAFT